MFKPKLYIISLLVLGFSTFFVQVVLLREYLAVYNGNELGIGLFFSSWMFANALGAFFGNRVIKNIDHDFGFILFHALLASIPFLAAFLGYFIKGSFFHAGEMLSLSNLLWISFIYLFPFCFIAGAFFPFVSFITADLKRKNIIGKAYALESIGALTGAALIHVLILQSIDLKHILLINFFINMVLVVAYFSFWKGFYVTKSILFIVAFMSAFFISDFDVKEINERYLYQNQEVVNIEETEYGSIIVTSYQDGSHLFINNSLYFTSTQKKDLEEKVHFPMLLSESPENVLVFFGGENGFFQELEKYSLVSVEYVEPNKKLHKTARDLYGYALPSNVHYIARPPLQFLQQSNKKYDVILLQGGNPQTIAQNRFYSLDFFQKVKQHLTDKGIYAFYIDVNYNYLSEAEKALTSIVHKTLSQVFAYVRMIPGEHLYFIASGNSLQKDFVPVLEQKQLNNIYVNEYYIMDDLLCQKATNVERALNKEAPTNKRFKPLVVDASLSIWEEISGKRFIIWIVLAVMVLFAFLKMDNSGWTVFTAGFTGASMQTILLILFQVYFGTMYHYLGIILGLFMAGLFLGAFFTHEDEILRKLNRVKFYMMVCLFLLIGALFLLSYFQMENALLLKSFIFLQSFIFGGLVGRIFTCITFKLNQSLVRISSTTYALDMLGAAIGSLLIAAFVIPQLGIYTALFILLMVNSINLIWR